MTTQPASLALLQFSDSTDCKRWIETLPLTNIQVAQQALTGQIALATRSDIPAIELLKILEVLRAPAAHLQHQAAVKYAGRALPLEGPELAAWKKTVALWETLTHAYSACRDTYVRGDSSLRSYGALIVLRGLQYTACSMFEHYLIRLQPSAALWRKLHQLYTFSEQSNFAHSPVGDMFNRQESDLSCTAVFCRALLAQLANPFALSMRQLTFMDKWLESWASLVGLFPQPVLSPAIPSLGVDLAGHNGATLAGDFAASPGLRYLDLEHLARTLRQLITLLKQGQPPGQLGLGDAARQPGCENLLMLLYIQWCRAGTSRGEERSPGEKKAQVCLGMHAAHFYIGDRAFRAPGSSLSRQEEQDLQLFGRISERTERMLASDSSLATESWQIVNHSSAGFMGMLRDPDARIRINHGQLIAVRCSPDQSFRIGVVQWLCIEESNELFIGTRLFPGSAHAIAVRPVNFKLPGINGFERALLLPEISAPAVPTTLILPPGWHQPGRFVELHGKQKQVAKFVSLLEKGSDFERCTISLC